MGMATIPGFYCAEALAAVHLPFDAVVRALMDELDLTYEEATAAALQVRETHPRSSRAERARSRISVGA
jgi:hypothetical protein